jgi:hypothetical protein
MTLMALSDAEGNPFLISVNRLNRRHLRAIFVCDVTVGGFSGTRSDQVKALIAKIAHLF